MVMLIVSNCVLLLRVAMCVMRSGDTIQRVVASHRDAHEAGFAADADADGAAVRLTGRVFEPTTHEGLIRCLCEVLGAFCGRERVTGDAHVVCLSAKAIDVNAHAVAAELQTSDHSALLRSRIAAHLDDAAVLAGIEPSRNAPVHDVNGP